MSAPAIRSRPTALMLAVVSAGAFLGGIHLLPSLLSPALPPVLLRLAVQLAGTVALTVAVSRFGRISAPALGWQHLRPGTLGWGMLCALATMAAGIAMIVVTRKLGLPQPGSTLAALASKPAWVIVLVALTAGVTEELVFRGLLINLLERGLGSRWLAAALSLAVFAGAHASGWGPWYVLSAAAPGLVLTLFYLWKRDIAVCILGHFLTDLIGLLGAAAQGHHP